MGFARSALHANPLTLDASLACANAELDGANATAIVAWALERAANPVLSTNFRPGAAALIHLVTRARPDIPVIWIDTGYNTPATYRHVETLVARWKLNLHCYTPRVTPARRAAIDGGIPHADDADFMRFTRDAKLEPFERAFNELKPDVWFTGVRAEHSSFRRELGVVSRGTHNTLRVAPTFHWSSRDIAAYLALQGIEDNDDYADPTKPDAHRECGLQLLS